MRHAALLMLSLSILGCQRSTDAPATPAPTMPSVAASGETEPTLEDGATDVRIWLHPSEPASSLIVAAAGTSGVEVYGLDGKRRQQLPELTAGFVELRYGFKLDGDSVTLVLVHDTATAALAPYTVDPVSLTLARLPGEPIKVAAEVTGVCSFRSPITGKTYALIVTDEGSLQQWELFSRGARVQAALVRTVPLGKGAGYCAADDHGGWVYFADETLGLFRLPADPEAETEREPLDLVKPFGGIEEEPKGVTLVRAADGSGYVLAADVGATAYRLYDFDGKFLGSVGIGAGPNADAVGETEGIAFAPLTIEGRFPAGLLVVTDQDNEGGASNFKLVSWQALLQSVSAPTKNGVDPRELPAPSARTVKPRVETPPTVTYGDAADDPAIWVDAAQPARSAVLATDKKLGLYVYDLSGRVLQTLPDGRMNNVDLRYDFPFVDGAAPLVAADNRSDKTLVLYRFDTRKRALERRVSSPVPTGLNDPYGVCMYRSARSGEYFVFVNDGEDGRYRQWRVRPEGRNVAAEMVREFVVGSIAEGCVADDETGRLYVAEEGVGLWRYSAEPDGGSERKAIDRIGGPNPIVADVEGLGLYRSGEGRGYLVVSNQGANNYALYRREGENAFVGVFHIVADETRGIDGAAETDGLDVVSASLGPQFPGGLLVVQDGRNITPAERQNYKFVAWDDVATALGLAR